MAWSVLDLSIITDELIGLLRDTIDPASTVWKTNGGPLDFFHVTVSGAMPETDRDSAGCLLSLYLLHVSQDPTFRNTPVSGPLAQRNRSQPMSLDLYYLLTSFANKNYNQEQQAMGLAMRCFHERTIMHVPAPQQQEYSITMEVQNADEMSSAVAGVVDPVSPLRRLQGQHHLRDAEPTAEFRRHPCRPRSASRWRRRASYPACRGGSSAWRCARASRCPQERPPRTPTPSPRPSFPAWCAPATT